MGTRESRDPKLKQRSVFLSYARQDAKHRVLTRLHRDLESLPGVRVWTDVSEIKPGQPLLETVDDAVRNADAFVLTLSRHSSATRWAAQEFFLAYADQLRRQQAKILPVTIDPVPSLAPWFLADLGIVVDLSRRYEKGFSALEEVILRPLSERLAAFDLDRAQPSGSTIITIADDVNRRLLERFARNPEGLRQIDRRRFEELIATLFDEFGFQVELTQRTRDGGRDVIAIANRIVEVKYLIECKRPDPGGYVGVRPVRELYGVRTDERATKAILATTAHFSRDAMLFFERHRWELEPRDFNGLCAWLQEYESRRSRRVP